MKITQLKIRNILGIQELDCTPGAFNEITGSNNQNKTNILNAIKSVVEGGHDATLLRQGAEQGEVVLVIDDTLELRKKVTARGSKIEARQGGTLLRKPQETIAGLADLFSVNPVAFLNAPKADRARVLLESMPITIDFDRVERLVGQPLPAPPHHSMPPLAVLDAVRANVYDERTSVNRILQEKRSTIEQLQRAMPEAPQGIEASESDLEEAIAAENQAESTAIQELQQKVEQWMTAKDARLAELRQAHEAEVEALRAQIAALTVAFNEDLGAIQAQTTLAKERQQNRLHEIRSQHAAVREPIQAQLSVVKANRSAIAKREQTQETINTMIEAVTLLEAESAERTEALRAIDDYKKELMSNLPIPNVEVVNGEITRDGIPFDRLNTAQRVDIAIELAKLRAGKLGVVCADGLEAMDVDTYADFEQKAQRSGLQFFITRVGRGDLTINSRTEEHEEVH